jgi:hypothetical protein
MYNNYQQYYIKWVLKRHRKNSVHQSSAMVKPMTIRAAVASLLSAKRISARTAVNHFKVNSTALNASCGMRRTRLKN